MPDPLDDFLIDVPASFSAWLVCKRCWNTITEVPDGRSLASLVASATHHCSTDRHQNPPVVPARPAPITEEETRP